MKSFCVQFLLITSFLLNHLLAEITTTDDLTPIYEAVQAVDEHALVIFDVNDVLMIPADQLLRKPYKTRFKEAIARVAALRGSETASSLEIIVKRHHRVVLVDPKMVSMLNILKKKSVTTIALTNAGSGVMKGGGTREDLMLEQLRSVGIDFRGSFPSLDVMSFAGDMPSGEGGAPLFKNGVIFTGFLSKGQVLQSFLQKVDFHPSQIVFVDDKQINLESVETFCTEKRIPFRGFRYTGSENHGKEALNEKRAELQLSLLTTEKRWADDEEANQLLSARP